MELGHAYSVLVVSASAKFNESVRSLLPERFYWPVTVLTDAAGARRELLENSYDLVVINTPLPDEFGTRLAQDICQHSAAGVLLLVKAEHFPDIDGRLTPQGVLVLSKPMSTSCLANPCGCCAVPGSVCGGWKRRMPPLRKKWRRSAL